MSPRRPLDCPPALDPRDLSLFLDFDGTLVELAGRPDAVVVGDAVAALLARLAARLGGRVALVSGRSIAQLDAMLAAGACPVAIVGSHGAEVRGAGGDLTTAERPPALREAEALFRERFGDNGAIVIEVKTLGVALHYRGDPSRATEAHGLAERFGAANGLCVQKGKMMVELRTAGADKGGGIAALMAAPPFAGHRPVFIGDDLTDETGFRRCAELGGMGILVGPDRPTAAACRLPDVAAVHAWLVAL